MSIYELIVSNEDYLELDAAVTRACGKKLDQLASEKPNTRRCAFEVIHKFMQDFEGEETEVRDTDGAVIAATSADGKDAAQEAASYGMDQLFAAATSVKIATYPESKHNAVINGDYRSCKTKVSFPV
ncbi:MAG TPA: hypothetical protein VD907_05565 [Verrucomicrobiae bacterium]|nr:hypothetical protein [Verrucomicrobiae bacterium]